MVNNANAHRSERDGMVPMLGHGLTHPNRQSVPRSLLCSGAGILHPPFRGKFPDDKFDGHPALVTLTFHQQLRRLRGMAS